MNKIIIFSVLGLAIVAIALSFVFGSKIVPAVTVSDQVIRDGQVFVSQAVALAPSWLVIQTETNGVPGPVIGFVKLNKGENNNVSVKIDVEKSTPKLFAMIHEDDGKKDNFDFPDNDMPLIYNNDIVSKMFLAN